MLDISFTGGSVTVKAPCIGTTTISEFSDEGAPITCNDIEVTGNAVSLNGTLITWSRPTAYIVSVTVIPMSENDSALHSLLEYSHVRPTGNGVHAVNSHDVKTTLTINSPVIDGIGQSTAKFTFTNGRILSGPTAVSSNAEGKMSARTYTFVFEQMTASGKTVGLTAGAQIS